MIDKSINTIDNYHYYNFISKRDHLGPNIIHNYMWSIYVISCH